MKNLGFFAYATILVAYVAAETIRVRGNVHCGFHKKTMIPEVALLDEDFSGIPIISWFDSDDVLAETRPNYGEHFTLDGDEIEIFSIEPYLRIRHQCFSFDREDIVDLSEFSRDPSGVIQLGHIILKHNGYTIQPDSPSYA